MNAEFPRYSYHLWGSPISANGGKSYISDQYSFVSALSKDSKKKLIVRLPYKTKYGWEHRKQWFSTHPNIQIYQGRKASYHHMMESQLVINTYNATSMVESLAWNIPTIAYWNPNHWELNEFAKPIYEILLQNEILHFSPESAARKINSLTSNIDQWWYSNEVQNARKIFVMLLQKLQ